MPEAVPIPYPSLPCPHCQFLQWVRPRYFGRTARCKRCSKEFAVGEHIKIPCPRCQRNLKIRPKHFGEQVSCIHCDYSFQISEFMQVPCPSCRRNLRVRPEHLGREFRCKHCSHMFRALGPDVAAPLAAGTGTTSEVRILKQDPVALQDRIRALEAQVFQLRDELQERTKSHSDALLQLEDAQEQLRKQATPPSPSRGREPIRGPSMPVQGQQEALPLVADLRKQILALETRAEEAHRLELDLQAARAENDRLRLELRKSDTLAEPFEPMAIESLASELESVRAESNRLKNELDRLQAMVQSGSPATEEVERLSQELDEARAERNQIAARREMDVQEAEYLRNRIVELEQSLAQLTPHDVLATRIDGREEIPRPESRADWEREHQTQLAEMEQRLRAEHVREQQTLAEEMERIRRESEQLRQERDTALAHAESLQHQTIREIETWNAKTEKLEGQWTDESAESDPKKTDSPRGADTWFQTEGLPDPEMEALRQRLEQEREQLAQEVARLQQEGEQLRQERDLARQQLEDASHERDAVTTQLDQARSEVEQLRQERDNARTHVEERSGAWERERQELEEHWRQEHRSQTGAIEERLAAEVTKARGDHQQSQEELARLAEQLDRERHAWDEEVQRARHEAESFKQERNAALKQVEVVQQEGKEQSKAWEAEKQQLRLQLQREHQMQVGEVKQRLAAELARVQVERRQEQETLENTRREYDRERQTFKDQIENLRQEMNVILQERDGKIHQIELLQQELKQHEQVWENERQALRLRLQKEHQGQLGEVEERLNAEINALRTQIDQAKEEFDQERQVLAEDLARMRQEADLLRDERETAFAQIETTQQEAKQRTQAWENERKALKDQYHQKRQEEIDDLNRRHAEALDQAHFAHVQAEQQLEAATRRFEEERQGMAADLQRLVRETDTLRQERETLMGRARSAEQQATERGLALEQERQARQALQVRAEAERAELAQAAEARLREHQQQTSDAHEALHAANLELTRQCDADRQGFEQERQTLAEVLSRAREELDALREEHEGRLDELRSAREEFKQKVEALEGERLRLQQQLERDHAGKLNEVEQRFTSELEQTRSQNRMTEQQLAAARVQLEKERRELRDQADRIRREADALRQERDQSKQQLEAALREMKQVRDNEQQLKDDLARAQAQVEQNETLRQRLVREPTSSADLLRIRQESENLRRERDEALRKLEEVRQAGQPRVDEWGSELETQRLQLQSANQGQNSILLEEVQRLRAEEETLRRERDNYLEEVQASRHQTSNLRQELAAALEAVQGKTSAEASSSANPWLRLLVTFIVYTGISVLVGAVIFILVSGFWGAK